MKIRSTQFEAMHGAAEESFERRLQGVLEERYPHVLPRFSTPYRKRIMKNILGRARGWGVTWDSALVRFAEVMLAVSPSFDEQPGIRAVLESAGENANGTVLTLHRRVDERTWESAEAEGHDLPLFLAPGEERLPAEEQCARAVAVALGDWPAGVRPEALARMAVAAVEELDWKGVPDAALVLATGLGLYGMEMGSNPSLRWAQDIFSGEVSPRQGVAMLKLRIALDHGRFV